ncbi:hypothetical protein [Haematobacter missouriensis]
MEAVVAFYHDGLGFESSPVSRRTAGSTASCGQAGTPLSP